MRKPDCDMYRMAYDVSQTAQDEALYVDDRLTYIEVARSLDIPSLHYKGLVNGKGFF